MGRGVGGERMGRVINAIQRHVADSNSGADMLPHSCLSLRLCPLCVLHHKRHCKRDNQYEPARSCLSYCTSRSWHFQGYATCSITKSEAGEAAAADGTSVSTPHD